MVSPAAVGLLRERERLWARGRGNGRVSEHRLLRSLAQRNLLRGYLSDAELRQGNTDAVNAALHNGGFLQNTPLWFYVLKEEEVRADGNSLGELGSRIVVETQIGIMRNDKNSYMNFQGGWDPSKGVKLPTNRQIRTIRDFLQFADLRA